MNHYFISACMLGLQIIAGALLGVPAPASASAQARTPQVTLTLLSEQPAYVPGRSLTLGLRFDMIPHWHVYWRNPGDSGEAPRVDWGLPSGWHAGALQWPVPQRIPVGPLVNYGYEDSVMLLTELTPTLDADGDVIVRADVDWLVCREECIPQSASIDLRLPVAAATDPDRADPQFEQARAHWPVALPGEASYRVDDGALVVRLTGLTWTPAPGTEVWFAAHDWGPVSPSSTQHWLLDGDDLTLRVPTGDAPRRQPVAGRPAGGQ